MSEPLQPFAPPAELANLFFNGTLLGQNAMVWFVGLAFVFWVIYSLVAIYHWFRYSHASWVAFPAILVHLFVSLSILSTVFW